MPAPRTVVRRSISMFCWRPSLPSQDIRRFRSRIPHGVAVTDVQGAAERDLAARRSGAGGDQERERAACEEDERHRGVVPDVRSRLPGHGRALLTAGKGLRAQ